MKYIIEKGDALKLLGNLGDESVDSIITDPPYSSGGLHSMSRKNSTSKKYLSGKAFSDKKMDFFGDCKDQHSYLKWLGLWLDQSFRIISRGGVICIFTDWRQLPTVSDALQIADFTWCGVFVWDKKNGRPNKNRFRQSTEFVVWGSKGDIDPNIHKKPVYLKGSVAVSIPSVNKRHHQTEKPQELMKELVKVCPENGTILDPFMGSGSTGIAALDEKREFIGFEKSNYYFNVAKRRLNDFDCKN